MKCKIIILAIILIISTVLYQNIINSYRHVIKINWNIKIPKPNNIIYIKEKEPSFHGDGQSYYVLEYNIKKAKEIKSNITFHEGEQWIQEEVLKIIDYMQIPREFYPDFKKEYVYYMVKSKDSSELYLLYLDNKLYIVEQLC